MEIEVVSPRGYCYGVINAIKLAKQAYEDHPNMPIYVLGMIVHNSYVVKALKQLNIITLNDKNKSRLELIDDINEGVIVLSAHGSDQKIIDKANKKGLIVYDATCRDVLKTQSIISSYLNKGYQIIYYGKNNHPEAIAAKSISFDNVHIVESYDDILDLKLENTKIFMTNQTTISIIEISDALDKVKELYPNIVVSEEVCNATRIRQEAVLKISDDVDIVLVIGDPESNNSNKLANLAQNKGIETYMIESLEQLEIEWLKDKKKVAITSGASTPSYLCDMVINHLKQFDYYDKKTHEKEEIDISKII